MTPGWRMIHLEDRPDVVAMAANCIPCGREFYTVASDAATRLLLCPLCLRMAGMRGDDDAGHA